MRDRLRRLYYRIGIHAAPPGTLLYYIHVRVRALYHRGMLRYASGDPTIQARFGGTPYYDIERVRRVRRVDGLALIFFIGLGDYLLATPLIEALRLAYPGLLIYGFASTRTDRFNSALVAAMLRANRHVDAVFTYRGRAGHHWPDYDFHDCLKDVPKNFMILPVIYSTDPAAAHRVTSLFEAFNLPVRLPVPVPILEATELSSPAAAILTDIQQRAARHSAKAIVCCHFSTRSSDYLYPAADELITTLARSGHVVVTFSETEVTDDRVIAVDVDAITPADTIELLRALKDGSGELYVLSVNSVMWPVSSGLEIVNLGLHIFMDPAIHQYVYPNIFVVTQHAYPRLSPGRMFIAPEDCFKERTTKSGIIVTDFASGFVFDCFTRMRASHRRAGVSPCARQPRPNCIADN